MSAPGDLGKGFDRPNTLDSNADLDLTISSGSKILGYVTVAAIATYLIWRLFFTLPFSYGSLSIMLGVILFLCEFLSGAQAIINYLSLVVSPVTLERPDIPDSWYPDIDVFIATHNEDVNLLYNTLNACLYLDYPDKSKVHIHVCDDGNRPEVKDLADRLGVNYIGFPEPKFAKAGNLNNAIAQTHSPLLAFLDADMIPRRDFLTHVVPHFYLPVLKKVDEKWVKRSPEEIDPDYKVGFVQAPQNFYNPDLFQFNLYAEQRIPNEQLYFFREVNTSRNDANSSILCGSGFIASRGAMADAGNFAIDTITEDFETGINIQNAGYSTYSIQEELVNGLAPETIPDLIAQRERWGRGTMQTLRNVGPFFDSRIPVRRRIFYLCSVFYWLSFFCRFIFIMSPILVALFNVYLVETSLLELLAFWTPYYVLHSIAFKRLSGKTRTVNWSNVFDTVMFPFLFIPVLLEMAGIRLKRFRVTGKGKGKSKQTNTKPSLILPHALMLTLSLTGIIFCLVDVLRYNMPYNIFILFWLFINSKNLLMAIFFMLGRVNERFTYRSTASVPAELELDGKIYTGATTDISEGGCSLALDYPAYVPTETRVAVRLFDRGYQAAFLCSMVQVRRTKASDWTYNMKLEKIEPDQLSQFRQIIYDRTPSLPETVNETMPILEDLKSNIDNRFRKKLQFFSRTQPRVAQRLPGYLPNGDEVILGDFSYRYLQVDRNLNLAGNETVKIDIKPGVHLMLTRPEEHLAGSGLLYKVVNWEDWKNNPHYQRVLGQWAHVKPEAYPRMAEREVAVDRPLMFPQPLLRSAGGSHRSGE